MRCDAMRFDAMRCDVMRFDAMGCDAMRCDAMRCDVMRCDAMRRCGVGSGGTAVWRARGALILRLGVRVADGCAVAMRIYICMCVCASVVVIY